jgi:hypothetical protein
VVVVVLMLCVLARRVMRRGSKRRKKSRPGSKKLSVMVLHTLLLVVQGHMSLVVPGPARNAVDRTLPLYQQYPWYP